jgi:hypothetical protein
MGELRNIVKDLDTRVLNIEKQFIAFQANCFIPKVDKTQEPDEAKYYYAVIIGRKTGIFTTWYGKDGAEAQVKGFPDSYHRKFRTLKDARVFLSKNIE